MAAFNNKVKNSSDGRLGGQGLFIQVNYPVRVGQDVDVFLQAVLEGTSLEQRAALWPIT